LRMGGRERMGWNLYLLARYASSLCSLAPLAGGKCIVLIINYFIKETIKANELYRVKLKPGWSPNELADRPTFLPATLVRCPTVDSMKWCASEKHWKHWKRWNINNTGNIGNNEM
jgi:hypothetical protein